MKNIDTTVVGEILTIRVHLAKDFGPSASKKNVIIATTEGSVAVPGREEVKFGLNVYRRKTA